MTSVVAAVGSRDNRLLWSLKYASSSVRSRRRVVSGVALKSRRPSDKLISASCRTATEIGPDVGRQRESLKQRASRAGPRRWTPASAAVTNLLRHLLDRWPVPSPTDAAGNGDDRWQYPAPRRMRTGATQRATRRRQRRIFSPTRVCLD